MFPTLPKLEMFARGKAAPGWDVFGLEAEVVIAPGAVINSWTIAALDSTGKRALCSCACGTVREIAVAALMDGSSTGCGCRQTPRPRAAPQSRVSEMVSSEFAAGRARHWGRI